MILGIDPGWATFGCAMVDTNGDLKTSFHGSPKEKGTLPFLEDMYESLMKLPGSDSKTSVNVITDAYIERFVTYNGINTNPEKILMFIGALELYLLERNVRVHMVRAIEWKPTICKYLVRVNGFSNPYPKFDKKFSVLAARELSHLEVNVDHEADAICLAYLNKVEDFNKRKIKK